ncbi:acyltransferase family protein [Marinobacterium jannaschii]|uniref:acyltransferase family protein n=1 Tax=Marinobacterium jannaschii TaxID=64970 RepID=UPI0014711125|nr:acyltransferase [Marinobacterium jannaschii]
MIQKRIGGIQFLRAFAALLVVYFHSANQVAAYDLYLPNIGEQGVDLFFVISGFIMVLVTSRPTSPVTFLKDRIRRVVPLYWFFTVVMAAALWLLPDAFKNAVLDPVALVESLLFIPAYHPVFTNQVWPVLIPGWSLHYEVYFYLLFAIGLLLPRQLIWLWMSAALSVIWLLANLMPASYAWAGFLGNSIVFEFLLGMGIAWIYLSGVRTGQMFAWPLMGVSLLLLLIPNELPRVIGWGVPAAALFWSVLNLRLPESRLVQHLGDCSYSLYLSHLFVLGVCAKLLPPLLGDGLLAAVAFVVLSLLLAQLVAVAVHHLIDQALLRPARWQYLVYQAAFWLRGGERQSVMATAGLSPKSAPPGSKLPREKARLPRNSRS